ncbi:MAG: peptidase C15 [Spirulinaceae cyanobacterium RM2_2_10]|nr:peptidase C15 [Spirulinaceae cyanobacterium SM2_1_0]NJO20272.1 peptidase C15 [Spirulinaceae cyanobacterium RM2_2_10]
MSMSVLLTSFQTWQPHQISNSSDDLIRLLLEQPTPGVTLHCLRRLPVETATASQLVLRAIRACQPDWVLCGGMAETRSRLSLESNARCGDRQLFSRLDLPSLVSQLATTEISDDAGRFVCEDVYFAVLDYLQQSNGSSRCLFVHVPVLTVENQAAIVADMQRLLAVLAAQTMVSA